jgi:hypothetical protein
MSKVWIIPDTLNQFFISLANTVHYGSSQSPPAYRPVEVAVVADAVVALTLRPSSPFALVVVA